MTEPDGSSYYRGSGTGTSVFITHSRLKSRSYIKGDDAFFLFSLEGVESFRMSHINKTLILLFMKHYDRCVLVLRYF